MSGWDFDPLNGHFPASEAKAEHLQRIHISRPDRRSQRCDFASLAYAATALKSRFLQRRSRTQHRADFDHAALHDLSLSKMARVDITTRALDVELAEASVFHAVVVSCPQPKETRMHLTNLIDLIAEVAAKRVAKEGKQEEDTPDAVRMLWRMIRAARWNGCHNFTRFLGFGRVLDRAA